MIFPFKVALEVQHRTRFSASVPAESFQTLTFQALTFRGAEDLGFLVATTTENQQAVQTAETFVAELIRELEEQAAATESTESEEMAKRTRNQRRGRGPSANKKDAGGEDLDKTAARASPETASVSPKPHLKTTIGTPASPTDNPSSQSLERTYTEDSLSFRTALSPARKVTDEDTESSQGHSPTIPSLPEPSRPTSSPSVLASPKMSDKSAITSPRASRVLGKPLNIPKITMKSF
jgi:hypothetical protein